jgi:hypothetical protein
MLICAHCGSQVQEPARFCSACGNAVHSAPQLPIQGRQVSAYPLPYGPTAPHAGGFGQVFGLDPRIVLLTTVVDTMLFGGDFLTMGMSTLLSVPAGIVMGLITYKAQRHWYQDDRESAIIKGLIVGLLTAIPTSLPGFLTIPSGIVGMVHLLRKKREDSSLIIERRVGS